MVSSPRGSRYTQAFASSKDKVSSLTEVVCYRVEEVTEEEERGAHNTRKPCQYPVAARYCIDSA